MNLNNTITMSGTTDISKTYKWQYAKKHAEHDPNVNHKNKNIDSSRTHLNAHYVYADKDQLLEDHWKDYIESHDQRMINKRDRKKCYGTASNYFKQKGKRMDETLVGTAGDVDTWGLISDAIKERCGNTPETEARIANAFNTGSDSFARNFNDKYQSLQITEILTNVDEAGSFHYHGDMVHLGTTKTGKPSTSFDRALLQATGNPDSKTRLATFRAETDAMLVNSVSLAFADEFKDDIPEWDASARNGKPLFEMYRKHATSVGVDHDTYVETKEKATRDARAENQRLKTENDDLQLKLRSTRSVRQGFKQQNQQLKAENDALTPKVQAKRSKLADLSNELTTKQDSLADVNQQLEDARTALQATQQAHQEAMAEYDEKEKTAKRRADDAFMTNYKNDIADFEAKRSGFDEKRKDLDNRQRSVEQNEFDMNETIHSALKSQFSNYDDDEIQELTTGATTLPPRGSNEELYGLDLVQYKMQLDARKGQTQSLQKTERSVNESIQQRQTRKSKQKDDGLSF